MEDVLALYAEPADELRPVVCFDETPRQLIGEARVPTRATPGKRARLRVRAQRDGQRLPVCGRQPPWRHAKVTDQRTCNDVADCMRDLVDDHDPDAERIRVVLDNLSAHSRAALYQRFAPEEARRILSRLECHFTPEHASWLTRVGIEIDRDRGDGAAMPRAPHPRQGDARPREQAVGAQSQPRRRAGRVDVHGRARPRQARSCVPGSFPSAGHSERSRLPPEPVRTPVAEC